MKMKHTLLLSAIIGMLFSATAISAELGDRFNPYVTPDEISVVPSMRSPTENRLADRFNPYIISNEVLASEECSDPESALVADRFNPYVTFAQLESAEMTRKC